MRFLEDIIAITPSFILSGDDQSVADFDSDIRFDISLTSNQGLQNIFNCLHEIMNEFNSQYLECKQIPYTQAYTICTVIQLLTEHCQIMETSEIVELTKSITAFAKLFGSSISKHRKRELSKLKHTFKVLSFSLRFQCCSLFPMELLQ